MIGFKQVFHPASDFIFEFLPSLLNFLCKNLLIPKFCDINKAFERIPVTN